MGTGYTRQSSGDIATNNTIEASHLNDEYNQLEAAFNSTTGHSHDGSLGEGPLISLTGSVTGILPVANGGTNASTASAARASLGLVIGTDVQAQDAELAAIAGLTSVADRVPYFTGSGTAALATFTSFGRSLVDDASASAARTTLGVDAAGTDNSTDVTIAAGRDYITIAGQQLTLGAVDLTTDVTGILPPANMGTGTSITTKFLRGDGTWQTLGGGSGDMLAANNLSDLVNVATARTNLGVDAAGTDNSTNVSLAGTPDYITIAGQVITRNLIDLTTDVTGVLPTANMATIDVTTDITGIVPPANLGTGTSITTKFLRGDGTWQTVSGGSGDLLAANNLSDLANATTARTNLGVEIGVDVQAHDAGLTSIAALTTLADRMIYTTASDTYAVTPLTSAGRALIDDASASAQRTTLGLGTAAILNQGTGASDLLNTSSADTRYLNSTNNLSDLGNAATARTNLGVVASGQIAMNATTSTDTTCYIPLVGDAVTTAQNIFLDNATLSYNASTGTVTSTDYTVTSDLRLKKNIEDLPVDWTKFNSYRAVNHEWKKGREGVFPGFIAQDIEVINPALVATSGEDKILSVNYAKMAPEIVKHIQDLHRRLEELENK